MSAKDEKRGRFEVVDLGRTFGLSQAVSTRTHIFPFLSFDPSELAHLVAKTLFAIIEVV